MSSKTKFVLCVLATLTLVGCGSSPTGRNQLKLFSEEKLAQVGEESFQELKKTVPISNSLKTNGYVMCVAEAITAQVPKTVFDGDWEVVVFDKEDVNAFALPGGKIGVYTGLLEITENAGQLAAVIGHEVGHVIAGHGNERASSDTAINFGLQVAGALLESQNVEQTQSIMQAIGLGAQIGIALPYSRIHETEADQIGLELMAQAGFEPQEAVMLWKNMSQASGNRSTPELLSTHPSPNTRIDNLEQNIRTLNIVTKGISKPTCD